MARYSAKRSTLRSKSIPPLSKPSINFTQGAFTLFISACRTMQGRGIMSRVSSRLVNSFLVVFFAVGNLATPTSAQPSSFDDVKHDTPGQVIKPGESVHLDVELALVNVTVTDPYSRLVTGLEPENFRVFEDNVEQEVVTFSSEDVPISIGVILDLSGSMADKLGKEKQAAVQFLRTANPQDEFFLVGFNEHAELLAPFTKNIEDLESKMLTLSAKGKTALLDAIYLGLTEMRNASWGKRALLIISDGGDNSSRYNEKDIKRLAREADTQLHSVGIFEPVEFRSRTPEELYGPTLLNEMVELTGGRSITVDNVNALPDIAAKIGAELRNQYVVGYRPSHRAHDARWRKIKIKLRAPKGLPPLTAYAKTGYYAPGH
jgi:Ca-activated chloride channel family protein